MISSRDAASVVGQRLKVAHSLQSISCGIQAHNRSISLQACYGIVGDDAIDGLWSRPLQLNGLVCGVSDIDSQGGRREICMSVYNREMLANNHIPGAVVAFRQVGMPSMIP